MGDGWYKKKGNPVWYCRKDPITGKATCTGQETVALRDLWYTDRMRRKLDPEYKPESSETNGLNAWCNKVIERKRRLKSEATASFYEKKLGHVVRIMGTKLCGDPNAALDAALTPANWDRYVAIRMTEEGVRATTVKKEIGCAKVVAKAGKREKAFNGDVSLFRPDDLVDDYKPGSRFLTPEEMPKLLDELRTDFHRAHVAAAVAFAARYSEAFRVHPEHIDLDTWTVRIPGTKTKGSDDRIPIADPFRPYLLMALPFLPLRKWGNGTENRVLATACKRAKIERVTTNDLRRTHASWLTEAGVPDSITSRVMRHVDERMVRTIYGRSRPEKLCEALDRFFNVTRRERPPEPPANDLAQEAPQVAHKSPKRQNRTGFRGVYAQKRGKPWRAAICAGELMPCGSRRREIALGTFNDASEAARAYDTAAVTAFGSEAVLNFPVTQTLPEVATSEGFQQKKA